MALISCPECGDKISDRAASCPHCGNPMSPRLEARKPVPAVSRTEIKTRIVVRFVLALLAVWIVVYMASRRDDSNTPEPQQPQQTQSSAPVTATQPDNATVTDNAPKVLHYRKGPPLGANNPDLATGPAAKPHLPKMTPDGTPIEAKAIISSEMLAQLSVVDGGVGLIRINGYRCDSISAALQNIFSRGFDITCNDFAYKYDIQDRGGNWVVKLE